MTCCWTVCMTLARKRSLSRIMPYFHISFVTSEMRCAGNRTSLGDGGLDRLGAGILRWRMMLKRTSSSSGCSSSRRRMISSAGSSYTSGR